MRMRMVTFNLENFDDGSELEERIAVMRPQFVRLDADVLCLQEINSQESRSGARSLRALEELLDTTRYAGYYRVSTNVVGGSEPYSERNLVVLSRFEILSYEQYKHEFAPAPLYRMITATGSGQEAEEVNWERPILHTRIRITGSKVLHLIDVHLKSKLPTPIPGQQKDTYTWSSASGWAEGFFLSSMKRVGQALEVRMYLDRLFEDDEDALIAVCGDFNSDLGEVPVQAIRGDVENTGNEALAKRVMVPCENTIPEPSRYSLFHMGKGQMIDHLLVSRSLLQYHRGTEIHNELLHDESISFATDVKYPESDHAPVIAEFELPEG